MTYEKGLFAQADPGIVSGSTTERKQMSTKTSFKRIALVAVTALGAGVLSVAPASAAFTSQTFTAVVTSTPAAATNTTPGAAGTAITLDLKTTPVGGAAGAAVTQTATYQLLDPNGTDVTSSVTFGTNQTTIANLTKSNVANVYTLGIGIGLTAAAHTIGTATFTPAMGGQYLLKVSTTAITVTDAHTALTDSTISTMFVSGAGANVSATGKGTSTIGAVTGGIAKIDFCMAAHTTGAVYNLTSAGVGVIQTVAQGTTTVGAPTLAGIAGASDFTQGARATAAGATLECALATVASTVAGTQTLTWTAISASTGAPTAVATATVTWGAAVVTGTVSAGNSTSIISTDIATPFVGTTDATISAPKTANALAATIKVILNDTQSTPAAIASKAVTATISGSGLLGGSTGTGTTLAYTDATIAGTIGRSITVNTDALGQAFFGVFADGSSGKGTITISQGTTVLATETVTFYGDVASFKATVKRNVAASGAATTAALDVVALDANAVVVPSVGITVTSGTTATIASFTETTSSAAEATAGTAVVDVTGVSGKFGPVVLTIKDTATGLISTTATVNVGATEAKTVTAAFDKATYTPGELVTLTISALDANGVAVGDTASVASSYTILTNAAVQGTLPTAAEFKLGKQAITFYAPLVSGPLKAEITLLGTAAHAAALANTKVTASATVGANTDISAITTLINSLIAKINALSKLVAKIQKKVKA